MKKIGIVGHLGGTEAFFDGQTVKTKNLYKALVTEYGVDSIYCLDTYNYKKHILSFLINCIKIIAQSENIIVLPAHNGVKVFLPLFVILNFFFRNKLHYDVIGGWLPEFLEKRKWLVFFAKKLNAIYVENTIKPTRQ